MPRPRQSLAQAAVTGASYKNAKRYRDRAEQLVTDELGDPPDFLKSAAAEAWQAFRQNMPWLNKSHRGITELASILQARQQDGVLGVPGQTLLLRCLGSMGATPASSRFAEVSQPDDGDPAAKYFT